MEAEVRRSLPKLLITGQEKFGETSEFPIDVDINTIPGELFRTPTRKITEPHTPGACVRTKAEVNYSASATRSVPVAPSKSGEMVQMTILTERREGRRTWRREKRHRCPLKFVERDKFDGHLSGEP
ncbi:hypothetical protein GWI33_014405 [Rhynchophorus ferrugineus]|uniref:Uncharacterized protein n=1 Tax=Rhynchophorus ferrugineus TaxID=354439 RepID=A0A834I541_RHYFE|nr:hypothetical protein GWI33_014405 [Rhynchophorus ferrugineus]